MARHRGAAGGIALVLAGYDQPGRVASCPAIWGVWIDERFYVNGHPRTRWARNLARNPAASIHLESAAHVVIVEGVVEDVEQTDHELGARIASSWDAKYGELVPDAAVDGIFRLVPHRARGWSENLRDGTVWTFEQRL